MAGRVPRGDGLRGALGDDGAAVLPALGSEVDDPVGGGDDVEVVLDDDHGVAADWIVDLGPEGGKDGGAIVAEGTPETVAAHHATSHTGRYLRERLVLEAG